MDPLRVALDLSPLVRPFPVSVVRTVAAVVRELAAIDELEVVPIEPPPGPHLARWRQAGLPRAARASGADVLHSFTSAFPLAGPVPVVQTVHEVPWRHGAPENAGLPHRAWVHLGRWRAAATCCPSERVAQDLRPHPRLHVVPWGVGAEFREAASEADARLRTRIPDLPRAPFVLALGATRPKKRLDLVCAGAAAAGLAVVVTGERTPTVDENLRRFPGLVACGGLPDEFLPPLVRAAGAVAVLSISEGFALPVLEALGCGTPVVVARGTVQAATSAGAGIEVDPEDPGDVARGLALALTDDAASSARRERGLRAAGARRWADTARALVDVWSSVR